MRIILRIISTVLILTGIFSISVFAAAIFNKKIADKVEDVYNYTSDAVDTLKELGAELLN